MLDRFEMIKHLLLTVLKLDLAVHCGLNFGPLIIFFCINKTMIAYSNI